MPEKYRVYNRTCSCSGKPVDVILRTATTEELEKYNEKGAILPEDQAVFACPICNGLTIHWLFIRQGVRKAVWALGERYCCEPITEDTEKWW